MAPSIILSGYKIICCKRVTANFHLHGNSRILVKGIVYSPKGRPLANAAVEVRLADSTTEKFVGITFTTRDGSYGISLPKICGEQKYILIAYSP